VCIGWTMKKLLLIFCAAVVLSLVSWKSNAASGVPARGNSTPVLVELFTSEGCSSCPPADRLLQDLDRTQPVSGAQLIVLSEHVDYWNHIGWADPYSSRFLSDRQSAYSDHFRLGSVYTPQMVVDGTTEFVGNDSRLASQACEKARGAEKIPVRISAASLEDPGMLQAHVEIDPLPESFKARKAEVYVVVALNHAESQVLRGENEGRRLTHVAVVQSLTRIGSMEKGKSFGQDVRIKLDRRTDSANLRVIAFAQESGPGPVLGSALQRVTK
jgi:hypothetical protein